MSEPRRSGALARWARAFWFQLSLPYARAAPQERVFALACFAPDAIALLRATFRRAEANGAAAASVRQLAVEALALPQVRAYIDALELDHEVIVDAMAAPLGDPGDEPSHDVAADRALWIVCLVAGEMHAQSGQRVGALSLATQALAITGLGQELESFGMHTATMRRFFAHGVLEHAPIDDDVHPRVDVLEVHIDNDDFTPQPFVTEVLRKELGLSRADAVALMWTVHTKGSAGAASLPRHEAIAAANRALDRARESGHPLRVRVEPV